MIAFIDADFLSCVGVGFVAGASVSGLIVGIRAVVRIALRVIKRA